MLNDLFLWVSFLGISQVYVFIENIENIRATILEYPNMFNYDKVSLVRFSNNKVWASSLHQEKNFEPFFQVPIKYAIYLLD